MSAPDTNVEKQTARHKGPLVGMALIVGATALLFVVFFAWTLSEADEPVAPAPSATAPVQD